MEPEFIAALALVSITALFTFFTFLKVLRFRSVPDGFSDRVAILEKIISDLPGVLREEARSSRDDLRLAVGAQSEALDSKVAALEKRFGEFGQAQSEQFAGMRTEASDGRARLEEAIQRNADGFSQAQTARLQETNLIVRELSERLSAGHKEGRSEQKAALESITTKIEALIESNNTKQEALRVTVAGGLEKLQAENSDKLEKMRATVEEKLQGTLEKRIGESFKLVSDRLEQVHKGLGEMQTLATGVGDLKRVLSNVKSRGGWGEVQLGMLLEDMLTRDQYDCNVRIRPDSGEIVEFAVRLPGRGGGDEPLWLPIDAKFPHEDYDRLLIAQDAGVPEEVERAASALERAVRQQAKTICEKYVHPPYSTDFAIMYLPTEGLFAEVIRRPGLASELQSKHRILVQGPTTLAALLNSLQMGFRTLAIEKRSSEVWQVLGAAKAEFEKYGQVWEKLGKQLDTARKTVEDAGRRTRAVTRRLRDVETLEGPDTTPLLDFTPQGRDDDLGTSETVDDEEVRAAE